MSPEPSIRFGAEDSIVKKTTTISFWVFHPLLILAPQLEGLVSQHRSTVQ